jgi:hypothetical protein
MKSNKNQKGLRTQQFSCQYLPPLEHHVPAMEIAGKTGFLAQFLSP